MKYLVRETRFENGELMLHLDGVGNILVPHTHIFASRPAHYVARYNLARETGGEVVGDRVIKRDMVTMKHPKFIPGHYETQRRARVRALQWLHSTDDRLEELVAYNTRMMEAIESVEHDNPRVQTRLRNNVARLTVPKGNYPNVKALVEDLRSGKPDHVVLDKKRHRALSRIDTPFTVSDLSLEDLLGLRTCFFDIEIPLYKTDATVSWVGLNFDGDEHIVSLAETAGSQAEVIAQTAELIERYDPLIMVAYNAKFDLGQLRDRGLVVGNRDTKPVYETATNFFERMTVRGRTVLDPYRMMQQAVPVLPNHKLDTTLQWAGHNFVKSLSYDEMAELELQALDGDRRAIQQIKGYLQGDVQALRDLWRSPRFTPILSDFLSIASAAKQEVHRVTHSATALDDTVARGHFEKWHAYPEEFVKLTPDNVKHRSKQLQRFAYKHARRGLHKDVHVLSVPYAFYMRDMLQHYSPAVHDLFTMKPHTRHLAVSQTNSLLKHIAMLYPAQAVDVFAAYYQLSQWGQHHFDRRTLTAKKWAEYSDVPLKQAQHSMDMLRRRPLYEKAFNDDPRRLQERIHRVNQRCLAHLENHDCTLQYAGKHWYVTGPNVFDREHASPLVPVARLDNVLFTPEPVYEMFGKLNRMEDKGVPTHTLTVHEQQILSGLVRGQLAGNTYRVNDVMDLFAWDTPENHVLFTKSTGQYTGFTPKRTRFDHMPSLSELSKPVMRDRLYKRIKQVII